MEDDKGMPIVRWADFQFQSTSPVWRTTGNVTVWQSEIDISIHVPRVEDDVVSLTDEEIYELFQSTSPVWRTT